MTRTQRLEAALRMVNSRLRVGDEDPYVMEVWSTIDAALTDTSPSCCEETRRATRAECDKEWNEATAFASQPKTPTMCEIIDAHDAEVRLATLVLAENAAVEALTQTRDNERKAIGKGGPSYSPNFRHVALIDNVTVAIRALSNQALHPIGGLHDSWCDEPKCAGPCNCRLSNQAPPKSRQDIIEECLAEMCEHVGRVIKPELVTEIRNELEKSQAESGAPIVVENSQQWEEIERLGRTTGRRLPVCPTCGGSKWLDTTEPVHCPDCVGGK